MSLLNRLVIITISVVGVDFVYALQDRLIELFPSAQHWLIARFYFWPREHLTFDRLIACVRVHHNWKARTRTNRTRKAAVSLECRRCRCPSAQPGPPATQSEPSTSVRLEHFASAQEEWIRKEYTQSTFKCAQQSGGWVAEWWNRHVVNCAFTRTYPVWNPAATPRVSAGQLGWTIGAQTRLVSKPRISIGRRKPPCAIYSNLSHIRPYVAPLKKKSQLYSTGRHELRW